MSAMSFRRAYWLTIIVILSSVLLGASVVSPSDPLERVRAFTRAIEFDYVSWTVDALGVKLGEIALGTSKYLPLEERSETVIATLELIHEINQVEAQLNDIYADPAIPDPDAASQELRDQLDELKKRREELKPLAEAILQQQVNEIVSEAGLGIGGQVLPPVLYHTTPPPDALIISPRDVIRQDHNISISPDISVDEMETLEDRVDQSLDVSSLVVGIGGIGLYPTMVMETTDINQLARIVAHEWVHNYLTLHPLGFSYMNSPEVRTMNETAASIAGNELGKAIVAKYYPEYLPPEPVVSDVPDTSEQSAPASPPSPPVFDFMKEMHLTRVTADRLLAEGNIEQAESYMEMRRRFLWDHGYHFRKLNQAYFAFYGAYADQPGGAAGEDPVGTAVRQLRDNSRTLKDFIKRIAWMWNYDQLVESIGNR
jgi:hypothetical protein